jgi:XXXCH domain-containing protein
MKINGKKKKVLFDLTALSDFLRKLADAAEGRPLAEDDRFFDILPYFEKLSLKVKRKADGFYLKASVALPGNEPPECLPLRVGAPRAQVSHTQYKDLKNRLKARFRQIGERLTRGQMPAADAVSSFLGDSELMIGVPGKGEEYYGAYKSACSQFAAAFAQSDLQALQSAYDALKRLRNQAHRKYK